MLVLVDLGTPTGGELGTATNPSKWEEDESEPQELLVEYAWAKAGGEWRHILSAKRGEHFQCGSCGIKMSAHLGLELAPHFAHIPPNREGESQTWVPGQTCTPSQVEHDRLRDQLFEQLMRDIDVSMSDGSDGRVSLKVWCAKHTHIEEKEFPARPNGKREFAAVPNTRSDIVFFSPVSEGVSVIIEVVLEHEPEKRTEALYRQAGYPVILARPKYRSPTQDVIWSYQDPYTDCIMCEKVMQTAERSNRPECGYGPVWQRRAFPSAPNQTVKGEGGQYIREGVDGVVQPPIRHTGTLDWVEKAVRENTVRLRKYCGVGRTERQADLLWSKCKWYGLPPLIHSMLTDKRLLHKMFEVWSAP